MNTLIAIDVSNSMSVDGRPTALIMAQILDVTLQGTKDIVAFGTEVYEVECLAELINNRLNFPTGESADITKVITRGKGYDQVLVITDECWTRPLIELPETFRILTVNVH